MAELSFRNPETGGVMTQPAETAPYWIGRGWEDITLEVLAAQHAAEAAAKELIETAAKAVADAEKAAADAKAEKPFNEPVEVEPEDVAATAEATTVGLTPASKK